jgi:2-haloacid dehalogenase
VPDVRLKTRYKIAVLSNGDPDMLETARAFHKIPFDAVISVAVANSFKPHVATYTKAAVIIGVRMDEVLFVASHAFDCFGAKSAACIRPSSTVAVALWRHPTSRTLR